MEASGLQRFCAAAALAYTLLQQLSGRGEKGCIAMLVNSRYTVDRLPYRSFCVRQVETN